MCFLAKTCVCFLGPDIRSRVRSGGSSAVSRRLPQRRRSPPAGARRAGPGAQRSSQERGSRSRRGAGREGGWVGGCRARWPTAGQAEAEGGAPWFHLAPPPPLFRGDGHVKGGGGGRRSHRPRQRPLPHRLGGRVGVKRSAISERRGQRLPIPAPSRSRGSARPRVAGAGFRLPSSLSHRQSVRHSQATVEATGLLASSPRPSLTLSLSRICSVCPWSKAPESGCLSVCQSIMIRPQSKRPASLPALPDAWGPGVRPSGPRRRHTTHEPAAGPGLVAVPPSPQQPEQSVAAAR